MRAKRSWWLTGSKAVKRFLPLLAIALVCGLFVVLFTNRDPSPSEEEAFAAPAPAGAESGPATAPTVYRRSRADMAAEAQAKAARVEQLAALEAKKRQRAEVPEKTLKIRSQMQLSRHSAWQAVVEAHQKEFEALKVAAAQAPDQRVPCSICGAQGVLDLCVLCDHTGKCPNCRGTGKVFDEVCPACSGRGKCFLCSGSGKMPCPFCQSSSQTKEVITPTTPNPPADFPLD